MTENELLETRIRASLAERAQDVEATPALYQRVQRRLDRDARRPWVLGLAAAAAGVLALAVVGPALFDRPEVPDILPSPDGTVDGTPTEDAAPGDAAPGGAATAASVPPGTAVVTGGRVELFGADGSSLRTLDRPDWGIGDVAVSPGWTVQDGLVAVHVERDELGADGEPVGTESVIALLDQFDDPDEGVTAEVPATPNGGGVVFSPDGGAIAWVEGTQLHVLPVRSELDALRTMPLEGDVPDGLVLEQWFEAADAPVLLLSEPGAGRVWSQPMDVGTVFQSQPTDPAFVLDAASAGVADALLLPDLRLVTASPAADGEPAQLALGGDAFALPDALAEATQLRLRSGGLASFTVSTELGGALYELPVDGAEADPVLRGTWEEWLTVAPLVDLGTTPGDTAAPTGDDGVVVDDVRALGLDASVPAIGTDGTDLVVARADGSTERLEVYPQPESEAVLGELAVRPGGTLERAQIVVESSSEGETSLRLVELVRGEVRLSPSGFVTVTDGPVTGLVWSEEGDHLVWTDDSGLHATLVDPLGVLLDEYDVAADTRPVLDWVTVEEADGVARGVLTLAADADVTDAGVVLLGTTVTEDDAGGPLTVGAEEGGADVVVLDSHATPGAAVGPEFTFQRSGGTVVLRYAADGDRGGEWARVSGVAAPVGYAAGQGVVVIHDTQRTWLLTTDDPTPVELPAATDWDVVD